MYSFGDKSRSALSTCDHRLVLVASKVIKVFDFMVLEGHRDKATQNAYFAKGTSKLKWPNGKHNVFPSLAFDLVPFPVDWNDTARFYVLAGLVLMTAEYEEIKLRWGGDWKMNWKLKSNKFNDLGHFEIIEESPNES